MRVCSISVFIAVIISDIIIFALVKDSYMNEAVADAISKYQEVINKLSVDPATDDLSVKHTQLILKRLKDNYNISFYSVNDVDVKEIYNNTIFSFEELYNMEYQMYGHGISYTFYKYGKKDYIILGRVDITEDIFLYRIEDITYVKNKLIILVVGMAAILVVIIMCVLLVTLMIMKKILQPLNDLNDSAKHIADGQYEHRIQIQSTDEIGQLSENFNRMAEAVEIRTNEIQESEYKKTLFMGNLTHELKTPMTAISGYAQMLLTTKLSDENKEEALMYIYDECGRLERLSKKMMRLLELDNEEVLELKEIPIKEVFTGVSKACIELLKAKNIELVCEEHGEKFNIDVDLMTDALINLVDNAIKVSDSGEKIILSASGNTIKVQDFGKGIAKEEQNKILEPFYMVDKSRTRKNGGAGLGLALTSTIVRKHNCLLKIESELDKGTTMILQFV